MSKQLSKTNQNSKIIHTYAEKLKKIAFNKKKILGWEVICARTTLVRRFLFLDPASQKKLTLLTFYYFLILALQDFKLKRLHFVRDILDHRWSLCVLRIGSLGTRRPGIASPGRVDGLALARKWLERSSSSLLLWKIGTRNAEVSRGNSKRAGCSQPRSHLPTDGKITRGDRGFFCYGNDIITVVYNTVRLTSDLWPWACASNLSRLRTRPRRDRRENLDGSGLCCRTFPASCPRRTASIPWAARTAELRPTTCPSRDWSARSSIPPGLKNRNIDTIKKCQKYVRYRLYRNRFFHINVEIK